MTTVPNTLDEAVAELDRLRQENADLRRLLGTPSVPEAAPDLPLASAPLPSADHAATPEAKVALFRSLFRGRDDVYAVRWENERSGRKGYAPACEDPWGKARPKKYLPLTDQVVRNHLSGDVTMGVFPLLKDDKTWFLACDFDKEGWQLDALAYLDSCRRYEVPAYLERSRSGNGGHVWTFFSAPVEAARARQLGMRFLRLAMDARADMDLGSYDRFFPNQDFLPKGGFGNLIAAPLQKRCRASGNSEFVDPASTEFKAWPDQWAFLSSVRRLLPAQLDALLETVPAVEVGPARSSRPPAAVRARHPGPKTIRCEIGAAFSIERSGIPPWLLARIKHLASLHNPVFYRNEKLRLSNHMVPRFIRCYREDFSHLHLPRGVRADMEAIAQQEGIELLCSERLPSLDPCAFEFRGTLTVDQERAVAGTLTHDMGLLVAPPGAGKTVMGCAAIARRGLPTLVLADRKPLLDQWRAQLTALLGLPSRSIGQVGGGRDRCSGVVDLATIQSLARRSDLPEFFSGYGLIIVDECHHLPAATFEACIRQAPARYVLGLTATPYRRDGLQDLIAMQCGPIRQRMAERPHGLSLELKVGETPLSFGAAGEGPIQDIFRGLATDPARISLIADDVSAALVRGRRCLVLSQWKQHCLALAEELTRRGKTTHFLAGGQGKKERTAIMAKIEGTSTDEELVVIATGQFLGEGFDCPRLDTLFLAFPVAFRGKLTQYVGRVMRDYPGKTSVEVYDYVDEAVPVLRRMHARRLKAFASLGFSQGPGLLLGGQSSGVQ